MDLKKLGVGQRVVITLAVTVALTIVVTAAGGAFSAAPPTTLAPETQKQLNDLSARVTELTKSNDALNKETEARDRAALTPPTTLPQEPLLSDAAFSSIAGTVGCLQKMAKATDNQPVSAKVTPPAKSGSSAQVGQEGARIHLATESTRCPPTVELCQEKTSLAKLNISGSDPVDVKLNVDRNTSTLTIFRPNPINQNEPDPSTKPAVLDSAHLIACQPR